MNFINLKNKKQNKGCAKEIKSEHMHTFLRADECKQHRAMGNWTI